MASTDHDIHIDDGEMTDVRWFSRDEVMAALTGEHPPACAAPIAIAHHLIKAWAEGDVPHRLISRAPPAAAPLASCQVEC